MKKKFVIPLLLISFINLTFVTPSFAKSPNLPWKEGQIVAGIDEGKDDPLFNYYVYRVFIKKTSEGYLVQEFYKDSNKKGTDPFIVKKTEDVTKMPYAYFTNPISELSIDGSFIIWYQNGQKMQEGRYVSGKKDGLWTRWYENGQKWAEGAFKIGQLDGLWQLWRVDGSKINETYYKNGKLEAILTSYIIQQGEKKEFDPDKNFWLEIDEKGNLRSQVTLEDGKKQGLWVSWDDKGQKEMVGYYKNDKREGLWQTFWLDPSETKKSEGHYKNGKKEGLWVFWNKQGNKLKEEYYQEGSLAKKISFNK